MQGLQENLKEKYLVSQTKLTSLQNRFLGATEEKMAS